MTISDLESNRNTEGISMVVTGEEESCQDQAAAPLSHSPLDAPAGYNEDATTPVGNTGDDDNDDDDDLTVIVLDHVADEGQQSAIDWIEQTGPEMEQRRRNVLLRELRRVQRASFLHFALLCLIPTALLVIVIATVMGESEDCNSEATFCQLEPRTFVNAYTTRCVCDPIPVDRGG